MSRTIISLIEAEYRRYKGLGEGALEQLDARELNALDQLADEDLSALITIRGVPLRVDEGLFRSLAHTSYHVRQMVHIAKGLRASSWKYLTIPPGGSVAYT